MQDINPDRLCQTDPRHSTEAFVLTYGIPDQVHSILLLEAFAKAGLDKRAILAYPTIELDSVLEPFKQRLLQCKNDYEIAGFFLGFELLAEHNIAHVFECLQPAECSREELLETPYFQEHFKVEPEHIKRAITMAMSSCNSDRQIKSMLDTFHYGISFWNSYWHAVHRDILEQKSSPLKANTITSRETQLAKV